MGAAASVSNEAEMEKFKALQRKFEARVPRFTPQSQRAAASHTLATRCAQVEIIPVVFLSPSEYFVSDLLGDGSWDGVIRVLQVES